MTSTSSSSSSAYRTPNKAKVKRARVGILSPTDADYVEPFIEDEEAPKTDAEVLRIAFKCPVNQIKFLGESYTIKNDMGVETIYQFPPATTQLVVYEENKEADTDLLTYTAITKSLADVKPTDKLLSIQQITELQDCLIKTQPKEAINDFHTAFNFFKNIKGLPESITFFDTIKAQLGTIVVQSIYFSDTTNELSEHFKGVDEVMKKQREVLYAKEIQKEDDLRAVREAMRQEKIRARGKRLKKRTQVDKPISPAVSPEEEATPEKEDSPEKDTMVDSSD